MLSGHRWYSSGRAGSSITSNCDGGNKHRRSRSQEAGKEAAPPAARAGRGTVGRNEHQERQNHKRTRTAVGAAIANDGGAAAIAIDGSRSGAGAGAGAAIAAGDAASRAGDAIDVSEDSGGGEHDEYRVRTLQRLAVVKGEAGSNEVLFISVAK